LLISLYSQVSILVLIHEDLVRGFHISFYTVVIVVKVGGFESERIDFTDLDFTIMTYPSDTGVATTVFVSSYDCVFVDQGQVKIEAARQLPVDFLLRTAEYLKETLFFMGHCNQEVLSHLDVFVNIFNTVHGS
jgi:hypothetical protein